MNGVLFSNNGKSGTRSGKYNITFWQHRDGAAEEAKWRDTNAAAKERSVNCRQRRWH